MVSAMVSLVVNGDAAAATAGRARRAAKELP